VDTRAARKTIEDSLSRALSRVCYWLDLGNDAASGQFVLGQPLNARNRRKADRLRTVSELFPEIANAGGGEDPLPSCSAVEALDRQEPFINQTLAASALAMLAQLFRYGTLTHHGAFFNAKSGRMSAMPVDPDLWSKMGDAPRKATPGQFELLSWPRLMVESWRQSMTMTQLDLDLAVETKALVALAFRNGPIEDLHAGRPCTVCSGKPEISHISDEEMRAIMKSAVNTLYRLLFGLLAGIESPTFYPI
jgi:hypothetical protein